MDTRAAYRLVVKSLLTAVGIGLLVYAALKLIGLLVLVFGAVVIGVLIHALAETIERHSPFGEKLSFVAALVLIVAVLGAFGWLFGSEVGGQFSALGTMLPSAWERFQAWLGGLPGGGALASSLQGFAPGESDMLPSLPQLVGSVTTLVTDLLLLIFGSLFIAADPKLYRRGLALLFPKSRRPLAEEVLGETGEAIKLWMVGQSISMAVVGSLTGLGLWLVGVPAPLALGIIMGFFEIIPWLGPFLGAVPILILALSDSPQTALWALAVVVVVQQLEGSLITPYVHKKVVSVPPAVTVFGVIAGGILFGPPGLFFAAPLLIVCYVLVKRLYVEEALHTPTPVPGRDSPGDD